MPAAQRAAAGKWSLSRCQMPIEEPPKGEKIGPYGDKHEHSLEALVNLRLRRWDTPSGASVLLRYALII